MFFSSLYFRSRHSLCFSFFFSSFLFAFFMTWNTESTTRKTEGNEGEEKTRAKKLTSNKTCNSDGLFSIFPHVKIYFYARSRSVFISHQKREREKENASKNSSRVWGFFHTYELYFLRITSLSICITTKRGNQMTNMPAS